MKQLLVLSGKGGTGKTTIASCLIDYGHVKCSVDCDIDAPNLHISQQKEWETSDKAVIKMTPFTGMPKYEIDVNLCDSCGKCRAHCQFEAIKKSEEGYFINPYQCEGCSVCELVCQKGAINTYDYESGKTMFINDDRIFSSGILKMGSGNSGKLVTAVKRPINKIKSQGELVILDGSPGIGCPVIASMSGVDGILFVAEPSHSGLHDLERVIKMAMAFDVQMFLCINKYNLNEELTSEIKKLGEKYHMKCIGLLPYTDEIMTCFENVKKEDSWSKAPSDTSPILKNMDNFDDVIASMYQYILKKMEVRL